MLSQCRKEIIKNLQEINPIDTLEQESIHSTLEWVKTNNDIFRREKPDTPPKHLVSYCLVIDLKAKQILLTHHKLSSLWLPTGGHIEVEELPALAAKRELKEELNIDGEAVIDAPFFLSITDTVNLQKNHTDVSLWFLYHGDSRKVYEDYSRAEFYEVKWFTFEQLPFLKSDPHILRVISKVERNLTASDSALNQEQDAFSQQ
ncbi:MAG: NUDIX domain-containing protein [Chlamydiales bacterium]|nr:NUDIX domain-containing protein [Chlamydiales bacterium]NCF71660.1 NUDIX domain-containing protein [Chlamydiales bacterium]